MRWRLMVEVTGEDAAVKQDMISGSEWQRNRKSDWAEAAVRKRDNIPPRPDVLSMIGVLADHTTGRET